MSNPENFINPISRATLPNEIVKSVTNLIMRGVWKPGDMIPSEKELANRFQVGRSTIREALKSLSMLGVLETRAGEGSIVQEPTSELLSGAFRWGLLLCERNLDDLVDVRVLIEVECARRAAQRRNTALIDQLNASIGDMDKFQTDHEAFLESDTMFHMAIAKAAQNPIFDIMGSTIQSICRIWYPSTYFIPDTKSLTLTEHRAITEAISTGDPEKAALTMTEHLTAAGGRLRLILGENKN
jgi:GntR family transcriptional regulator, transcriptional repressor for pyruvate dehydrogenase complex